MSRPAIDERKLPEAFSVLRRRLESDSGSDGHREFIKILRLLEKYTVKELDAAIDRALQIGAMPVDVVRILLQEGRESPASCSDSTIDRICKSTRSLSRTSRNMDTYFNNMNKRIELNTRSNTDEKLETKSTVLLKHHLKALKMPTMHDECEKVVARCVKENMDHLGFLLQLCEQELLDREKRAAD